MCKKDSMNLHFMPSAVNTELGREYEIAVAEAWESSGTQKMGNVYHWKPLRGLVKTAD
jgi:hypothetical protein